MKITVKTLKKTTFDIEVKPEDSVADVKKYIETVQGSDVYPAAHQVLIHQGKVLQDGTTLAENKVAENNFVVITLKAQSQRSAPPPTPTPTPASTVSQPPVATLASPAPASAATPAPDAAPISSAAAGSAANVYDSAASNLVAGNILDSTIQQILDMGGGLWDRDTVIRALRAALNNPERAVEYLYSGIPEQAEAPPVARMPPSSQAANPPEAQPLPPAQSAPIPSSGPNANPLDLFPQGLPNMGANAALSNANPLDLFPQGLPNVGANAGLPNASPLDLFPQGLPNAGANASGAGNLDMLRNNPQFQAVQALIQANPQILQPLLQELAKQNPRLLALIQANQAEFLALINEPLQGGENLLGQLAGGMPQTIQVTPGENEAIQRLQAMGFDEATVLQVFFACNKNEELAANYLLDHMHDFED